MIMLTCGRIHYILHMPNNVRVAMTHRYVGLVSAMETQLEFVAPADWTMEQWCNEFAGVLSRSVGRECAQLKGWFQSYDGE